MSDHAAQTLTEVSGDLLNYLRRRVGDEHAADLLAESLTTAWRRVALLPEDHESARRWLFGIAHNVLLTTPARDDANTGWQTGSGAS